jgi:hypothetical protein
MFQVDVLQLGRIVGKDLDGKVIDELQDDRKRVFQSGEQLNGQKKWSLVFFVSTFIVNSNGNTIFKISVLKKVGVTI